MVGYSENFFESVLEEMNIGNISPEEFFDSFSGIGVHPELLGGIFHSVSFVPVEEEITIESRDEFNFTPLMRAVQNGKLDACKFLLYFGANVNAVGIRNQGKTALMLATTNKNEKIATDMVRMLLLCGANINIKDVYGRKVKEICSKNILNIILEFEKNNINT